MQYLKALVLTAFCAFFFSCSGSAQEYNTDEDLSVDMEDIQRIIDATMPEIEEMLQKGERIKPFATVILSSNDSLADITVPANTTVTVQMLKEEISIEALRGTYKAVAIFSETIQDEEDTDLPTMAIEIFAEHTNEENAYLFFYPFKIGKKYEVEFGESFGDMVPSEIYKP